MKNSSALGFLSIFVMLLPVLFAPSTPLVPSVHAPAVPMLALLSPGYGSNITDLNLLSTGATFRVDVNVTNAGPITGFDITLDYSISPLFNTIISTSKAKVTTYPGLFDGTGLPAGCSVLPAADVVLGDPFDTARIAVVLEGGCTVNGNGRLFSVTFTVTGHGATSLHIEQAANARLLTLVVGPPPSFGNIPNLQVVDAYFRNVAGIPPVAQFSYSPSNPQRGNTITFDATASHDPDNAAAPSKGISKYIWNFGDPSPRPPSNSVVTHVFIFSAITLASGYFEISLVVNDTDSGLPSKQSSVVYVNPGIIHDITVSVQTDKSQVDAGSPVVVTTTVTNRGNRDETVNLNVTIDYQQSPLIGNDTFPLPLSSSSWTKKYTLQTANLPPRVYTITAFGQPSNATNSNPLDNLATTTITVLQPSNPAIFSLSLPVLAGVSAVGLGAIGAATYTIRRRRKGAEDAQDKLA